MCNVVRDIKSSLNLSALGKIPLLTQQLLCPLYFFFPSFVLHSVVISLCSAQMLYLSFPFSSPLTPLWVLLAFFRPLTFISRLIFPIYLCSIFAVASFGHLISCLVFASFGLLIRCNVKLTPSYLPLIFAFCPTNRIRNLYKHLPFPQALLSLKLTCPHT
jgi:hypothetical protein